MTTTQHETQSHHLPPEQVADQQRKAVKYFIIGDAVFFACLIFTYFYLRALNISGGWIPSGGKTAASWQVWLIGGLTVASALTYRYALSRLSGGDRVAYATGALGSTILAIVGLAFSIYQLATLPILMSDGSYASVFIAMAAVQALHLLVLVFIGIAVWNRALQSKIDVGNDTHAVVAGYFWNWVALTGFLAALLTFFVR
ncbi:MAG: cytochrome c oxidase subunit 3 [Actinomycetes bacterium]